MSFEQSSNEYKYNLNIERAVLSAIIFDPEIFERVQSNLKPQDFYLPFHQYTFGIMVQLHEKEIPIDEEFIKTHLLKIDKWDEVHMLDLLSANPISNIQAYLTEIKDLSLRRSLTQNIRRLLTIENPHELLSQIEELAENKDNFLSTAFFDDEDINDVVEKEPEFILEDWLPFPKNALSMVIGKGGDGKSFLLIQAMLRYCISNPDKKVLGWLSEDTKGITKFRATRIAKEILHINIEEIKGLKIIGSDSKSQPFHIVSGDRELSISDKWHRFKQQFNDYDLIILDPLIAFYGGEENSNSQARVFTTLLNSWASRNNKTIIIIHHSAKGKEEVTQRGAGAFRDAVRLNYAIEVDPNEDQNRLIHLEKDNWGIKLKLELNQDKKVSRKIFPRALNFPIIEHNKEGVPISSFTFRS